MTSTDVFAGTSTETSAASTPGGVLTRSSAAASAATAVDRTSCASVSRLRSPLVRPPTTLASWPAPTGWTSTDVADSYTLGWWWVNATPPPTPAAPNSNTIHQCRRTRPRKSAMSD